MALSSPLPLFTASLILAPPHLSSLHRLARHTLPPLTDHRPSLLSPSPSPITSSHPICFVSTLHSSPRSLLPPLSSQRCLTLLYSLHFLPSPALHCIASHCPCSVTSLTVQSNLTLHCPDVPSMSGPTGPLTTPSQLRLPYFSPRPLTRLSPHCLPSPKLHHLVQTYTFSPCLECPAPLCTASPHHALRRLVLPDPLLPPSHQPLILSWFGNACLAMPSILNPELNPFGLIPPAPSPPLPSPCHTPPTPHCLVPPPASYHPLLTASPLPSLIVSPLTVPLLTALLQLTSLPLPFPHLTVLPHSAPIVPHCSPLAWWLPPSPPLTI